MVCLERGLEYKNVRQRCPYCQTHVGVWDRKFPSRWQNHVRTSVYQSIRRYVDSKPCPLCSSICQRTKDHPPIKCEHAKALQDHPVYSELMTYLTDFFEWTDSSAQHESFLELCECLHRLLTEHFPLDGTKICFGLTNLLEYCCLFSLANKCIDMETVQWFVAFATMQRSSDAVLFLYRVLQEEIEQFVKHKQTRESFHILYGVFHAYFASGMTWNAKMVLKTVHAIQADHGISCNEIRQEYRLQRSMLHIATGAFDKANCILKQLRNSDLQCHYMVACTAYLSFKAWKQKGLALKACLQRLMDFLDIHLSNVYMERSKSSVRGLMTFCEDLYVIKLVRIFVYCNEHQYAYDYLLRLYTYRNENSLSVNLLYWELRRFCDPTFWDSKDSESHFVGKMLRLGIHSDRVYHLTYMEFLNACIRQACQLRTHRATQRLHFFQETVRAYVKRNHSIKVIVQEAQDVVLELAELIQLPDAHGVSPFFVRRCDLLQGAQNSVHAVRHWNRVIDFLSKCVRRAPCSHRTSCNLFYFLYRVPMPSILGLQLSIRSILDEWAMQLPTSVGFMQQMVLLWMPFLFSTKLEHSIEDISIPSIDIPLLSKDDFMQLNHPMLRYAVVEELGVSV